MFVIALVQDCMTCGMCLVADVLSFVSSPRLFLLFSGDDDYLLTEQLDALGYDLSFRGWDF